VILAGPLRSPPLAEELWHGWVGIAACTASAVPVADPPPPISQDTVANWLIQVKGKVRVSWRVARDADAAP